MKMLIFLILFLLPFPSYAYYQNESVQEGLKWNVDTQSVLGATNSNVVCRFEYKRGKSKGTECKIPGIGVKKEREYISNGKYNVVLTGTFTRDIDIYVNGKYKERVHPNILFHVRQNGKLISIKAYSREGNTFSITAGEYSKRDNLQISYNYIFFVPKYKIKITGGGSCIVKLGKFLDTKKPFSYPLSSLIGVTQWHGNTAFQKPHKGIDFGATKEKVLAVYDGTVVSKGWDSYSGKCFSGGNYLVIQQKNGMYTAYFHLDKTIVNVGNKVKKEQYIGVSGNSGAWNCQKLGYHLHFETRKERSQSTHVNPVNYVNVDWNKIYTLGSSYNKGRLSGENPHPNY